MVVIIAEGKTDIEFLKDFILNELNISREKFEIKDFNGKNNIFKIDCKIYDEIENELDIIDSILITADADDPKDPSPIRGYKETESALKKLIKDLDFKISIDYYIFCDKNRKGYLESFLLSVLDDEQKECIEAFKECYKYELKDKLTYNTFYKQKAYPFDFNHPNFNELKTKLKNLFEGIE